MVEMLNAAQVKKTLTNEPDAVLVDALGASSYAERHLPGAISLPEGAPDFDKRVQQALPSKDAPIIVYCAGTTCAASTHVAQRLEKMGYRNVKDFKAGLEGWQEAGERFDSGTPAPTARVPADAQKAPPTEA